MPSTLFAQLPKGSILAKKSNIFGHLQFPVRKLNLLPEERPTSLATDLLKCIDEIQCFDRDVEEAASQTLTTLSTSCCDYITKGSVHGGQDDDYLLVDRFQKAELGEIGTLINEICAKRITEAIQERDDMWRRHETAQISFLQNENSQMLTGLHAEIERLHHHLRDLYRRLYVKSSFDNNTELENENAQLRKRLEIAKQNTDNLNQKLMECEKRSSNLEQQSNETVKALRNQLAYQGNRIRQLTDELREKTAQIAKLMAQFPFGTVTEATENELPSRIHFYSQPVVHWNPAPASFFGKKNKNLPHTGLIRNASITYPGGRPNVVAQRPRSHHLPSLYSKPLSVTSSGYSIEKPARLHTVAFNDRMPLTRSLDETQNSALTNSAPSSNPMNSKMPASIQTSMQNTI
uniref:CCDC92/74 N-terminal domain-containing protein n=1 Tax=Setaria digitata TaxID=48799 RepID=A0A915PFD3_9BILA